MAAQDIEMGDLSAKPVEGEITVPQFLAEVKKIDAGIARICDVEKKLSGYAYQANISLDNIPSGDVEQITENTSKLIQSIKGQIDGLKSHIAKHKETMNASDLKIEENAVDTAVRKFADAIAKYNATQVEYDKNVKARVKGVLKTVLDKSDAEIDQVIESGQSIEAIRGVGLAWRRRRRQ